MPRDPNSQTSLPRTILTTIAAIVGVAAVSGRFKASPPALPSSPADTPARDPASTAPTPGWSAAMPERLAQPTYWPAVLALAIAFVLWGAVTSLVISGVGLLLAVIGLAGWIGELRHE